MIIFIHHLQLSIKIYQYQHQSIEFLLKSSIHSNYATNDDTVDNYQSQFYYYYCQFYHQMYHCSTNINRQLGPITSKYRELQQKGRRQSQRIKQLFNHDIHKTAVQLMKQCPDSNKTIKNSARKRYKCQVYMDKIQRKRFLGQQQRQVYLYDQKSPKVKVTKQWNEQNQQDKSIEYLKSEEYKKYLQSITKINFNQDNNHMKQHRHQLHNMTSRKDNHYNEYIMQKKCLQNDGKQFNRNGGQWKKDRLKTQNYDGNTNIQRQKFIEKYINKKQPFSWKQPQKIFHQEEQKIQQIQEHADAKQILRKLYKQKLKKGEQKKKQLSLFKCLQLCIDSKRQYPLQLKLNQPKQTQIQLQNDKFKNLMQRSQFLIQDTQNKQNKLHKQQKQKKQKKQNKQFQQSQKIKQKKSNKQTKQNKQNIQNKQKRQQIPQNNYRKKAPKQLIVLIENEVQTDSQYFQPQQKQRQKQIDLTNYKLSAYQNNKNYIKHNQRRQFYDQRPNNTQNKQNYKIQYRLSSPFFRHSNPPQQSDSQIKQSNKNPSKLSFAHITKQRMKQQQLYYINNRNGHDIYQKNTSDNFRIPHEAYSQKQFLVYHQYSPLEAHSKARPQYKCRQQAQYYHNKAGGASQLTNRNRQLVKTRQKQRKKISLITKSQIILPK